MSEIELELEKSRELVAKLEARIKHYDEIIYASKSTAPNKRDFLSKIDLAKYDLKERYPEDYIDYVAYSGTLTDDILWYGYKWAKGE